MCADLVRIDGYAPIRDYAALGDGRTVALVARDGSIDWLCLPNLDSPSVFGAILDADRGGRFSLAPDVPFKAERRYLPGTNVLETTFRTAEGVVRVTDALTLPDGGLDPLREVARRIEGLAGAVPLRWRVEPRFEYGKAVPRIASVDGVRVAAAGSQALAVLSWDAGDASVAGGGVEGQVRVRDGTRACLTVAAATQEPLVLPARDDVEHRLDETASFWREWTASHPYDGPWADAVLRSVLALKLLIHAPTGAIAAAATTSLPEQIGGERNWDYRYSWVRDAAFTLEALEGVGCRDEAVAFFWWLQHASQLTQPRLQPLYQLDGGERAPEKLLPLEGYRGSRPVRIGNGAVDQVQHDIYGDLFQAVWLYYRGGDTLDRDTGRRLASKADHVCRIWREPDAGLWEVRSEPLHFTSSKMMCWVALDRAVRLAGEGELPSKGTDRWRREAREIRRYVETRCFSDTKRSYVRAAGHEELDAALLLAPIMGYSEPGDERIATTIDVLRRELGEGALLRRYGGEDGLSGDEGFFLTCSFWLVEALALAGRLYEAAETMEELLALGNDVGLYAEEVAPETGEFLGNFPQALVHLALVSAAACIARAEG